MKVNPNKTLRYAGLVMMLMGTAQIIMGVLLITGAITKHP